MNPKIAVVTGAGTGIGKACAVALAEEGFSLALVGRRSELLLEVELTISTAGGRAISIPTDVTEEAAVVACFEAVSEEFGRLDLLVNNAGMNIAPTPVADLRLDDWQRVVDVNLTGSFLCAREAFRLMKSQLPRGGRIINNGSISAHVPRMHASPYTATKHAITGLTRSLSLEGRVFDIACGQIDIGNAQSDMTHGMAEGMLQADGERRAEPVMAVENVARAVAYMASLPLDANVQFMTVMATKMPFIGRG
jgi:NAD(P)-dependent dehydrogenase (short-subunit alcohol dehydrogenase family)